jgi:P27 family predicted phage terminase small subunit
MPRGAPPKPPHLHTGNPHHPKDKRPQPVSMGGRPERLPEPPDYLNDDGKLFWEIAVPALHELNVLDIVDRPALEMAATAYERFHQARRVINVHGVLTRRQPSGEIIPHPAVRIEREAQATFLRFAEQFGLTASARARLGIAILQGQEMLSKAMETELGETELEPA